jgi:hypothetical protein
MRKEKIYKERLKDCDGTLKDSSLMFMNGNELTIAHFIRI